MDRRQFLKNLGIVTAGIVAADQLDLIEKLGWKRRFFPGFAPKKFELKTYALGFSISQEMLDDDYYPVLRELNEKHAQQWSVSVYTEKDLSKYLEIS